MTGIPLEGRAGAYRVSPRWRRSVAFLLPFMMGALPGCSILEEEFPSEVQITVQGGNATVRIVTSTDFYFLEGGSGEGSFQPELITSDTLETVVPHDRRIPLAPSYRVFVKVLPPAEGGSPEPVSLRVRVDGSERYNQTSVLSREPLQFFYIYQ